VIGQILKARGMTYGALPVQMLDRCSLSMGARLCFAVLDSCGADHCFASLTFIAVRMGLHPENKRTVQKYLRELVDAGFLEVYPPSETSGGPNVYQLILPDYCTVNSPEILKAALGAHVPANTAKWGAGQRNTPGRQKKASYDRQAWFQARADAKANHKRRIAAAQNVPVSSEHRVPVSSEHQASVQLTLGGCSVDTLNTNLKHEAKQKEIAPAAAGSPSPAATHTKQGEPAGWDGWAAAYRVRHGKRWAWSDKARAKADAITRAVGQDLVRGTWTNFLANDFWFKRSHPLNALMDQLQDHMPRENAPAGPGGRCGHASVTSTVVAESTGETTIIWCKDCKREIKRTFSHKPLTVEELEQMKLQLRRPQRALG
jgi:hypothetical protein